MFSGTVFARQSEPEADCTLPRSCWAFYERVDGSTPTTAIADALGMSDAETFAAVRLLQAHGLIAEPALTYAAYRGESEASTPASTPASTEAPTEAASGDGVAESPDAASRDTFSTEVLNARDLSTQELKQRSLHLPSLLDWLRSTMPNVKDYTNVKAFVVMEASDVLADHGVTDVDDLEAVERFDDPEAIRALEKAVRNNVNERIPESCYQ